MGIGGNCYREWYRHINLSCIRSIMVDCPHNDNCIIDRYRIPGFHNKCELMTWSGGLIDWVEGNTAFISVAFSWKLQDAYQRCIWYQAQGYRVRAGGPGTFARRSYLADVAELGGEIDALIHHNPQATIASRGCPVGWSRARARAAVCPCSRSARRSRSGSGHRPR